MKVSASESGVGLAAYWLLAYLGAAAVLLAALLSLAFLFTHNEQRLVERHLRGMSRVLADELGSRTAAVAAQLQRWRGDERLRAALLDGRRDRLRAEEEALALLVPGATGVVILAAADTLPGSDAGQRLSYAGVEMARTVWQSGQVSRLEVHRVNENDEHLAIAGPVMDAAGEQVLGVVQLMLPLSFLPRAGGMRSAFAHFHYRQAAGERLVVIDAGGRAVTPPDASEPDSLQARAPTTRMPVDGTSLLLFAWGKPVGLFSTAFMPWLGAIYASAVVLLGFAVWLPFRRQRRALEADLASLVALADDAESRQPLRATRNHLAEFLPVQGRLRRLPWDLSPAVPADAARADVTGADATAAPVVQAGRDLAAKPWPTAPVEQAEGAPSTAPEAQIIAPAIMAPGLFGRGTVEGATADSSDRPLVPSAIFRAYDVRGLIGAEINADVMRQLGLAVGSEARERGDNRCSVARDQRPSGAALAAALVDGLRASGCDVVDLGIAPTPVLYFAAHVQAGSSAAIVTASHNPARYNGLKVVLAGRSATTEQILALRARIERGDFGRGAGAYRQDDLFDDYIDEIVTDVALARPMKIVVDCGHAAASLVAPRLYNALGCEVIELDCDLDPALADAHMPDPSQPRNLSPLGDAVLAAGADCGLAFDADGDRLGVVDSGGRFIAADRVLMLLAADVLARHPGAAIVYDVKCSHQLGSEVSRHGGRPLMWRSGHSFLKEKMRELGAPLGGELSGHIVFGERWNGFDDALYAGARVLELLALDPRPSAEIFAELPSAIGTPELFAPVLAGEARMMMQAVLSMADRLDGVSVNTIDGLRAEFDRGWGLVRASNTQPGLVFRFQADDDASLRKIQHLFRRMMRLAAPTLALPF